jgi:hypothetical protein
MVRSSSKPPAPRPGRKLGLDKPCQACGKEIYYNYKSPIEGLCGRGADRRRPRKRRTRGAAGTSAPRRRPGTAALTALAVAAAAVAAFIAWQALS